MGLCERMRVWMTMCLMLLVSWTALGAIQATGPLRVLPANPRYFTDGTGRVEAAEGRQQFKAPLEGDAVLYLRTQ